MPRNSGTAPPRDFRDVCIEQLGGELLEAQELAVVYRQMTLHSMTQVAQLTAQLATARREIARFRTVQARTVNFEQDQRPLPAESSSAATQAITVQ